MAKMENIKIVRERWRNYNRSSQKVIEEIY